MNGRVYDAITAIGERRFVGGIRAQLLPGLKGEIVEIGTGTGASSPYYDPSAHVLALEPDRSMLARARERAKSAPAWIVMLHGDDSMLDDMPAASTDYVVAALVFCSVEDPLRTLKRIHRILTPGGSLVTIEHERAGDGVARLQDLLTPFWRRVAGNCHLDRVLEPALSEAGFSQVELKNLQIPIPMRRLLYGFAPKIADTSAFDDTDSA